MTSKLESTRRGFVAGTAALAASTLVPSRAFAADYKYVMKIATVAPGGTPWAKQLRAVKKRVQTESGGLIKVRAYLGGGLGDEIATAEDTKKGNIAVFGGSTAALSSAVPELECIELPYLFKNAKVADRVLDDVVYEELVELLWSRGFVFGFMAENGYRSLGTNFGPVTTPAALNGKKMRSMESTVHLDTFRALGASPVPMAVTEVLSSLQTGVVDGAGNTPLYMFAASWYQGITHYTLTKHIYQPGIVCMSKKWWNKLPIEELAKKQKEIDRVKNRMVKVPSTAATLVPKLAELSAEIAPLRKLIMAVGSVPPKKVCKRIFGTDWQTLRGDLVARSKQEAKKSRRGVRAMRSMLLKNFENAGIKVVRPTVAELAEFKRRTAAVHDRFSKRTTSAGRDLYRKIKAAV